MRHEDKLADGLPVAVAVAIDGDGVELVNQQDSRAWYGVKGDGYRRNVGWVGADDGLLAIDLDGDGKITDARELSFALWTADTTDTDLDGLRAVFDTNRDGRIDAADARFADLRVWQDRNSYARSTAHGSHMN